MDPFDANRVALLCADCIIFVNDFRPGSSSTPPTGQGKKFCLYGRSGANSSGLGSGHQSTSPRAVGSSPSPSVGDHYQVGGSGDKGKVTRARIKSMVKELVTGEAQQLSGIESQNGRIDTPTHFSECLQVGIIRALGCCDERSLIGLNI